MTAPNPVAERLLAEARKKTARQHSAVLARVALAIGVVAVLVSPISLLGWMTGATALVLGLAAARRPIGTEQARIAVGLGFAAILIGVFFFTMNIAMG